MLQRATVAEALANRQDVVDAAEDVSFYHAPSPIQQRHHQIVARTFAEAIVMLMNNAPPCPERSTAIAKIREARMWANAAIAMAKDEDLSPAAVPAPDPSLPPPTI